MINRLCNIKKDFGLINEFQNKILPMIKSAKFQNKEEKEIVENYVRSIFFNQWRKKWVVLY